MNLSLNKLIGQRPDIQYGKTERHTPDWLFILWMGGTDYCLTRWFTLCVSPLLLLSLKG